MADSRLTRLRQLIVDYFRLNTVNPFLFEFADLTEKPDPADRDAPRDQAVRKAWGNLDAPTSAQFA